MWTIEFPSKHDFMSRYALQDREIYTPGTFTRVGGVRIPQRFQNIVLGFTSTLKPTLSQRSPLQLRHGPLIDNRDKIPETPIAADLGIPFAPRDEINAGFPEGIGLGTTAISGLSKAALVSDSELVSVVRRHHLDQGTHSYQGRRRYPTCAFGRVTWGRGRTTATRSMADSLATASLIFFWDSISNQSCS